MRSIQIGIQRVSTRPVQEPIFQGEATAECVLFGWQVILPYMYEKKLWSSYQRLRYVVLISLTDCMEPYQFDVL